MSCCDVDFVALRSFRVRSLISLGPASHSGIEFIITGQQNVAAGPLGYSVHVE